MDGWCSKSKASPDCTRLTWNSAFKIQLQAMFIDTSLNSVSTVLANLHQSFHEAAVRSFEYARSMAKSRPIHPRLLIRTCSSQPPVKQ